MSASSTIKACTSALAAVTPETLTPEQISSSIRTLERVRAEDLVSEFDQGLPGLPGEKPDEGQQSGGHTRGESEQNSGRIPEQNPRRGSNQESGQAEEASQQHAAAINRELKAFNDELTRIKQLQQTLNLPQLEPLIKAARDLIRPLYNYTAALGEKEDEHGEE